MSRGDDLRRLIFINRSHLQILEEQAAKFGSLQVPPHILLEINERKETIEDLEAELNALYITDSEILEDESEEPQNPIFQEENPELEMWLDTAAIYTLLEVALDSEMLTSLCFDYYPQVRDDFTEGMRNSRRRRLLLEFCKRNRQLWPLVGHIHKLNSIRFTEHFPKIVKPLLDQLTSTTKSDREKAVRILRQIREPSTVRFLEKRFLEEEDPNIRHWLAITIGKIGGNNARKSLERIFDQLDEQETDAFTLMGVKLALQMVRK